MDYSTISNKTTFTDVEELTDGELSERYYLLRKQYDQLSASLEATKQELHETKRNYQTALDVQSHLNAELETVQSDEERRRAELSARLSLLQEQITNLREENSEAAERHAKEVKCFENEISRLKEENAIVECRKSPERDTAEVDEVRAALSTAISEAASVKLALEESRNETVSWRLKVEELMTEVEELRAAAEIRREELQAAGEREATTLAELAETQAMLHRVDSQDMQPHAAKGNSIFAEVEDKRQEMAKNLIQMKQTNARLRRDLANKQAELDALLHEKQTIWEQQAGASAHYDKELSEKYAERVTQLEGLCERQRRELARWFKQTEAAEPSWLPSVLDHLKNECEQLRAEVLSRGAAQLASAVQVRELRRKIALLSASAPKNSLSPMSGAEGDENETPKVVHTKRTILDNTKKKVSFN
ncbi:protein Spindly-like [Battus philenor]|uniref:protein Spindly-like n=1 Tax=Battus philenor TaxID=42288 RepID=UPI0035CFA988